MSVLDQMDRVIIRRIAGAGSDTFAVDVCDKAGKPLPFGTNHFRSYEEALARAQSDSKFHGLNLPIINKAKPTPPPAAKAIPAAPGMVTKRAPMRRKSSSRRKKSESGGEDWAEVVASVVSAADVEATINDFYDNFRERVQERDAEGHGKAVIYSQSTHNVFKEILSHHALMDKALGAIVRNLVTRVTDLEAKLANAPAYRGVWRAEQEYSPGSFVTHEGSVWHANAATKARPGDGAPDWTLAVKRGNPGKDAK